MNDDGPDHPRLPRSRDGRIPQWAIDDEARRVLAGLEQGLPRDIARAARPQRPPRTGSARASGSRLARTALVVAVVISIISSALWLRWGSARPSGAYGGLDTVAGRFEPGGAHIPAPGFEEARQPLGAPPSEADVGPHAFLQTTPSGAPVGYSPCRPLHYTVNPDGAPPGTLPLIDQAAQRVAALTGLRIVRDDPTTEQASFQRQSFQPERYGDRWAPVVVGFASPERVPGLSGRVAGLGGSAAIEEPGNDPVLVSGAIVLDGPDVSDILRRPRGPALAEAVILHEFGHVVGLGHVDAPSELMDADNTGQTDFGPGDKEGLAALGRVPCRPDV